MRKLLDAQTFSALLKLLVFVVITTMATGVLIITIGSIAAGMWLVACIAAGGRCPLLSVGVFALAALIQVPCLCRYGAELHSLHVHLHVCAGAGVRYVVCCACPCWRTERHSHSFVSAGHCTREVASGYA